jgi:hypothetical protein
LEGLCVLYGILISPGNVGCIYKIERRVLGT